MVTAFNVVPEWDKEIIMKCSLCGFSVEMGSSNISTYQRFDRKTEKYETALSAVHKSCVVDAAKSLLGDKEFGTPTSRRRAAPGAQHDSQIEAPEEEDEQ